MSTYEENDGIENFLYYARNLCPDAFTTLDLLNFERRPFSPSRPFAKFANSKLCIVIDGECCLDRLYGGFYSDWVCGGQWNRLREFLSTLISNIRKGGLSLVVIFDGSLDNDRRIQWKRSQLKHLDKATQILNHVKRRRTPPTRSLWLPPTALRSFLRTALRDLGVAVFQTIEDHKQEVMTFVRDHRCHVLLAEGAEYLFMEPPRFAFASSLKLTFRSRIQVCELVLDDVCRRLDLHPNRLCLVAALMGNRMLATRELAPLYDDLMINASNEDKNCPLSLLPAIVTFVRNLPTIDDIAVIGDFIFSKLPPDEKTDRSSRLVESVNYYLNATKASFHKFKKHTCVW